MRLILQRVSEASVKVDGETCGAIGRGLLILIGVALNDTQEDADWLVSKVLQMRIFNDDQEKMNLSLLDIKGDALLVSQFTLHASTAKGNRPSFVRAADKDLAMRLYQYFVQQMNTRITGKTANGIFGAMMEVSLVNSGPVTILIDSKNRE